MKDPLLKEKQPNTNKIGLEDKNANLKPDIVEREIPEGMRYAHTCSVCGKGMSEGYVVDEGMEHYCSDECLNQLYTPEQWAVMAGGDDNESNYWTEWEDEEDIFEEDED